MKRARKNPLLALPIGMLMAAAGHAATGPSSSESPYLVPLAPGVEFTSLLTVGDTVKKHNTLSYADSIYRLAGLPDGMGAFDNGDGTFTLLVNHEMGASQGAVRAHGSVGAFVSKWRVRKSDLKVLRGEDLIKKVFLYNSGTGTWSQGTTAFGRFCSADLAAASAFYNVNSDRGYTGGRIFMNGEENGPTGRAFAHFVTGAHAGESYEFPGISTASWENIVASPHSQDYSIVIGLDDTNLGKVYVYGGKKGRLGDALSSGLHGGVVMTIAINSLVTEVRESVPAANTRFSLVPLSDASGTQFLRPEDGAWDTQNPNRFYFVTTDRFDQVKAGTGSTVGRTRLWRLTFDNVENPMLGGTVEAMLDGTQPGQMYDNLTVDAAGMVWIQEDPGGQAYNAKTWKYNPESDALTLVSGHDVARFGDLGIPATAPHNNDEETSGIIEVTDIFAGVAGYDTASNRYFVVNVQGHSTHPEPALVQRGQLLLMKAPK